MVGSTATASAKESDNGRAESDNDDGLRSSKRDKAEDESDDDEDDVVNLNRSTIAPQQNDYEWEKKLLETLARVSLASVGGGLVGLSLDHTRRQQQQGAVTAAASSSSLKRGGASLAKTWSVSCFLFAAILETTRWISPTTVLYDFILQQQQEENDPGENVQGKIPADRTTTNTAGLTNVTDQHVRHYQQHQAAAELQRVALTVTGDYTIGGSMAGFMVASLAHQKHAMISRKNNMPRPVPLFGRAAGVGLGTALGLFAGVVQATIAVGEAYIQQQQQHQQQHQQ